MLTPLVIERPRNLAAMPWWPGARTAINLAIAGVRENPRLAIGHDFPDGTSMALEYQPDRRIDVPPEVYGHVGDPPLLSIIVIDHGVGWTKDRAGAWRFTQEHDAEKALREIAILLGKDKPKAVYGQSINPKLSRRQYWFRCEA